MVSECIPSVWEGERTLVGLPCMKTVSGVPPQVPATCLTQGLTLAGILAKQATLAGQTVPGICLGLSQVSSSMGLEA